MGDFVLYYLELNGDAHAHVSPPGQDFQEEYDRPDTSHCRYNVPLINSLVMYLGQVRTTSRDGVREMLPFCAVVELLVGKRCVVCSTDYRLSICFHLLTYASSGARVAWFRDVRRKNEFLLQHVSPIDHVPRIRL